MLSADGKITYYIHIKETFDPHLLEWFHGVLLFPQENGESIIVGTFEKQPPLRGLLDHVCGLEITIISIDCVKEDDFQVSKLLKPCDKTISSLKSQ